MTHRYLITGDSGAGKSVLAGAMLTAMRRLRRLGLLVVVSPDAPSDSPLAAHCRWTVELDAQRVAQGINWNAALATWPALYVEALTPRYPAEEYANLARAILARGDATVVWDEAHVTVPRAAPDAVLELWSRGRKRAVDVIAVTTSGMQRSGHSLHPSVIDHTDTRLIMRSASARVRDRIDLDAPGSAAIAARLPVGGYLLYAAQ